MADEQDRSQTDEESGTTEQNPDQDTARNDDGVEAQDPGSSQTEETGDGAIGDSADDEIAQLKDQVLRSLAEVENVKRRATRDVENAHKFAVERLLSDLIPVLDSLDKAVETASQTQGAEAIAEGVALSLKLFVDTLAKSGVEEVDPLGEPFDPQVHEAMTMVANPDAEPNSVMDVMAKGYLLNGRLVRAAKVIVVKGEG